MLLLLHKLLKKKGIHNNVLIYKVYNLIGLICLKVLILIKPMSHASVLFAAIVNFRFYREVCDGCHDLAQKALSFDNVVIVSVKGNNDSIHFWYISKD